MLNSSLHPCSTTPLVTPTPPPTPPTPPSRYDSYNSASKKVTIALVGKYTKLSDSYISVIKALKHAALSCCHALQLQCVEADSLEEAMQKENPSMYHKAWTDVCGAQGILVPGGFGSRGTEGMILAASYARDHKIPYLGEWWWVCDLL